MTNGDDFKNYSTKKQYTELILNKVLGATKMPDRNNHEIKRVCTLASYRAWSTEQTRNFRNGNPA